METSGLRRAAFLDRDGTIIHDAEYLADPERIELLPGAVGAIKRLNAAGVPVIVVTNQSGIARGLLNAAQYEQVRARLDELLAARGAWIDDTMMCPHHPDFSGPCDCRKPGVQLYQEAAARHGLDLANSLYVGDRHRDVAPVERFGGTGFIVHSGAGTPEDFALAARIPGVHAVDDLATAVTRALAAWGQP